MAKVKIFLSEGNCITAKLDYDELIEMIEYSIRDGVTVTLDSANRRFSFFGSRVLLIEEIG